MQQENRLKAILIQIWPTIYRIINSAIYFILSLLKGIIALAVKQIKGGAG